MGLGYKNTDNIRHNNNDKNREVNIKTLEVGSQCEILCNVVSNFTQNVSTQC